MLNAEERAMAEKRQKEREEVFWKLCVGCNLSTAPFSFLFSFFFSSASVFSGGEGANPGQHAGWW